MKLLQNGQFLFAAFFPFTKDGSWIKLVTSEEGRKGRFVYIKHGSVLITPITALHSGNFAHCMSGNPRGHLFLTLTLESKQSTRIIHNDDEHGENMYLHEDSKKTPAEGYMLPAKVDTLAIQHKRHDFSEPVTKNEWFTDDLYYFNKYFQL